MFGLRHRFSKLRQTKHYDFLLLLPYLPVSSEGLCIKIVFPHSFKQGCQDTTNKETEAGMNIASTELRKIYEIYKQIIKSQSHVRDYGL